MIKFIYKANKSNETMKYTKDKEYYGEFASAGYSNILLIKNDVGDNVLVYKFDFDYIRKVKE